MALTATSNVAFSAVNETYQVMTKEVRMTARGLLANTRYSISLEGADYGFATRQVGKNLGDPLVSDANGAMEFLIYGEIPFSAQYGQVDGVSPSPTSNSVSVFNVQNSSNNYRQTTKLMTLSAPGSTLQFAIPSTYYFVPAVPSSLTEGT